jgi:hypothetical protein
MTAYLVHRSPRLRETLGKVMPGVQWTMREPNHLPTARNPHAQQDALTAIAGYLQTLPRNTSKVSSRVLKDALKKKGTVLSKPAFTRGGHRLGTYGIGWTFEGRSFVRIPSTDHTETTDH